MRRVQLCKNRGCDGLPCMNGWCFECATEIDPRERLTFIDWPAPGCD